MVGRCVKRAARAVAAAGFATQVTACNSPQADPGDATQVSRGKAIYASHCAACHGADLEGQPNWRERMPNGRLPAPPHDATGHTWEHSDRALFEVTKFGFASKAGAAYQTDMRAFRDELSDEQIWAVISYIKSRWPQRLREKQAQIK